MSVAIVFSGQGSQHADMLSWLAEAHSGDSRANQDQPPIGRSDHGAAQGTAHGAAPVAAPDATGATRALASPVLHEMHRLLDIADWRAALADATWASTNRHAQVLITATGLAAWRLLAPLLPEPVGVAGYSVGELAAFAATGVVADITAVQLAARRAASMDDAARAEPGGLTGATGLPRALVDRLIDGTGVSVAISNGEDSVVLGGPLDALTSVENALIAQGGRCTRLPVAIASHTPAMCPAAIAFDAVLATTAMSPPRCPLYGNASDRIWTAAQARTALSRQIADTVRWDDCMDQLAQRAPACVLEIGGGQALARLWQQRHPDIPARSADEFRSVAGIAAWVRARCAS